MKKPFNGVQEQFFNKSDGDSCGTSVNCSRLNRIKFANGILRIGKHKAETRDMVSEPREQAKKIHLEVNLQKKRLMTINTDTEDEIETGGCHIEEILRRVYVTK